MALSVMRLRIDVFDRYIVVVVHFAVFFVFFNDVLAADNVSVSRPVSFQGEIAADLAAPDQKDDDAGYVEQEIGKL